MRKTIRTFTLAMLSVFSTIAQNQNSSSCGTGAPPAEWDNWFNNAVKEYVKNMQNNKAQLVTHEIPVIVHIIHFGDPVGTYPNIDTNQLKSQLRILNEDFSGTGYNVGNVPQAFSNLVVNTGITFCRATLNPQGGALPERGLQRVNAQTNTWPNPATTTLSIKTYMETYVKPSTIFDPIRYLNIWISDKSPNEPLNGYATYPSGTSLPGVPASEIGTANTDGIWIWTKAFGDTGTTQSPYDKGRTLTHEMGHWLGLRHIWGDGNCYTDYCSDTPPAKNINTGCPATPTNVNLCGFGQSPFGEMTMNFMDGTEDACKYMFTPQQNIRMQTALSQCNYRNALGTHNLCVPSLASPSPAVAGFSLNSVPCIGSPFTPFNTSSGNPPPTYIWSSTPPMVFNPAPSVANPAISINTPGNYTLSLIATNSLSSNTYTMAINTVTTCPFAPTCLDSISTFKNTDTLSLYAAPVSTLVSACQGTNTGYLTGTNCYFDKEFAQFFPPSSYSATPSPQINSAIILFDKLGTSGNPSTPITCRIYGGNNTMGPGAQIGSKSETLGSILAWPSTNNINFMGDPNYITAGPVIPFRYDFQSPVIPNNNSGFFIAIEEPYFSSGDAIRIYSSRKAVSSLDSNAWFLQFNNTWRTFRTFRNAKIQLGIMPIITCSPINGLNEIGDEFSQNVNLMPNPGTGYFQLIFTLPNSENITMEISNAMGQQITKAKMPNTSRAVYDLDLSSCSDGIYLLEIQTETKRLVKKLVINR